MTEYIFGMTSFGFFILFPNYAHTMHSDKSSHSPNSETKVLNFNYNLASVDLYLVVYSIFLSLIEE